MTTGVIYLLTSMKLASRLLVSIYSLRKWYDGPITVFTTKPKAYEFAELLAADPRLRVDVRKCRQRPGDNRSNGNCATNVDAPLEHPA